MKFRFILPILLLILALTASADRAVAAAPATQVLHAFVSNGSNPNRIIEGIDGNFYGVASGEIFKMTPSGSLTALYRVDADSTLVSGIDGNLYGTIATGGAFGHGSVFKLTLGGQFTTLCSFPADGMQYQPVALVQGQDGNLYGLTKGGTKDGGTFFKVTPSGAMMILRNLTPNEGDYGGPTGLIEGADGYFYTLSELGGSEGNGALQQLSTTGDFRTIYNFSKSQQSQLPTALAQGGDGNFYVAAYTRNTSGGNICQITPAGILTVIHTFDPVGQSPPSILVSSASGSVYGISHLDGTNSTGTIFRIAPNASFSIVHNFPASDALAPYVSVFRNALVAGSDGALYGTARNGGIENLGALYRVFGGGLTTLADFAQSPDGFQPAALIQGSDGSFFGTTTFGGEFGRGTVFKTASSGQGEILHTFNGGTGGARPSSLLQARDGNLYGFTNPSYDSFVTLFRLGPGGTFSTLYTFTGGASGTAPRALIQGQDGNLYGTVGDGGASGYGMVFRFDPSANNLTTLYSFTSNVRSSPRLLLQGQDGNFYGTTTSDATVFRLTPSGTLTTLHDFPSTVTALTQGMDGNLYGTTASVYNGHFPPPSPPTIFQLTPGGAYKFLCTITGASDTTTLVAGSDGRFYGTTLNQMFSASSSGDFTVVQNFDSKNEGSNPNTLLQGADGNYYGITALGGPFGGGTVFEVMLNLLPRPMNLATRLNVLNGNNAPIAGFIITGSDPKKVMIRGIGPSLSNLNGTLQDPTLELHQGNTTIATNDNWKMRADGSSQQAEIEATNIPPKNDLESAVVATLNPGSYTTILSGKNQGTGVGVVEVYDLAPESSSKLANISTRGLDDTGDNAMIAGLIVGGSGNGNARVMIRAIGTSLTTSGVANALQDPTLELYDGNGALLVSNDNWKLRSDGTSQQAEIEATTIPPANDLESAILQTLAPGNYTAIVRGKNNSTGVALVEVYNLQ